MFRITRGHSVQHISFPFPVVRDLDALHEEPVPGDASPAEAPVAERGDAESDAVTNAPR
jgi:hypothetical protein